MSSAALALEISALSTKIGARFLCALEEDHFDQLPGGIFNRGFVRAYARCVGLDEDRDDCGLPDSVRRSPAQSSRANRAIPACRPGKARSPRKGRRARKGKGSRRPRKEPSLGHVRGGTGRGGVGACHLALLVAGTLNLNAIQFGPGISASSSLWSDFTAGFAKHGSAGCAGRAQRLLKPPIPHPHPVRLGADQGQ